MISVSTATTPSNPGLNSVMVSTDGTRTMRRMIDAVRSSARGRELAALGRDGQNAQPGARDHGGNHLGRPRTIRRRKRIRSEENAVRKKVTVVGAGNVGATCAQ